MLDYLVDIMFLAGLPLLIPVIYSFYMEESYEPMLVAVLILILPGIPRFVGRFLSGLGRWARRIIFGPVSFSWKLKTILEFELEDERKKGEGLSQSDALALAAISWVVMPMITSIPYLFYGFPLQNSIFESMSGWTATGLSTINEPELLPSGMVLFRSFTQWIGGTGIVLFALLVISSPAAGRLFFAEGRESITLGARNTVKMIWLIYVFFTLLGVTLFALSGFDGLSSLNMTMTAVSTGGFLPNSMFVFNDLQKGIFVFLMIAGATSFALHFKLGGGQFRELLRNTEFRMMIFLILLFAAFLVLTTGDTPVDAIFDVTAAISGAGFTIRDMSVFSDLAKYVLILLMVSGACSGSTTGAIKLWRIFALFKTLGNNVRRVFLPEGAVQVIKINGKALTNAQIVESGTFIFMYMFVLLAGAGLIMADGLKGMDALFISASAFGNVGLATMNVGSLPVMTKGVLVIFMYLGRIEILPSLVMLNYLRR